MNAPAEKKDVLVLFEDWMADGIVSYVGEAVKKSALSGLIFDPQYFADVVASVASSPIMYGACILEMGSGNVKGVVIASLYREPVSPDVVSSDLVRFADDDGMLAMLDAAHERWATRHGAKVIRRSLSLIGVEDSDVG
jgi:hypothetical protein